MQKQLAVDDLQTNDKLVLLNEQDVDGCVDIARDGITQHLNSPLMQDFIQRFADNVAQQAFAGQPIVALNLDADESSAVGQTFTSMAINIQPLHKLAV